MLDLEPIKKREQAATQGPWFTLFGNDISAEDEKAAFRVAWIDKSNAPPDAEFIINAREDIPALIAEVERLRAAIEECCGYCWNITHKPEETRAVEEKLKGWGFRPVCDDDVTARDFKDESYCKVCDAETLHQFHDDGHERDSSGDWRQCLMCGKRTYGMG